MVWTRPTYGSTRGLAIEYVCVCGGALCALTSHDRRCASRHHPDQSDSRDEASDVRHVRDAPRFGPHCQRTQAVDQLNHDPEAEDGDCGQGHNPSARQHADTIVRKQYEISTEHSANRTRCADGGYARRATDEDMRQPGGDAARQVEHREPRVPHRLLEVVAENPQVEHVAAEMH